MSFDQHISSACSLGMSARDGIEYMGQADYAALAATVSDLEQLSFNLSASQDSRAFQCTLRWVIYKIVEENRDVTLATLRKILCGEYGLFIHTVDAAISSLTSNTLLKSINKWKNPRVDANNSIAGIHLSVAANPSPEFQLWMKATLAEFPELRGFKPPAVPKSRADAR